MHMNYLAILIAGVAGFFLGWAWYMALAKPWMAASGKTEADMCGPDGAKKKMPGVAMLTAILASLIMALMLHGILTHMGFQTPRQGAIAGAFIWFGFVITTMAVNNAFQMRKAMLTVIDGGYWLLVLVVQGAILGAMGG